MGVNSLPKTVTGQCRDCDLNPGPSTPSLPYRRQSNNSANNKGIVLVERIKSKVNSKISEMHNTQTSY